MHDIRLIRDDPAAFDAALAKRGAAPQADTLIAIDERRRAIIAEAQEAQTRRNDLSKQIGQAKAAKDEARAQGLMDEVAALKAKLPELEEQERSVETELNTALAAIPNLPAADVPQGADENDNALVHQKGEPTSFTFEAREHDTIAPALGMDFETGVALSGARFTLLRGPMARLSRALGQFMLDRMTEQHGFELVQPPLLVRDEAAFGTGQLPKFAEDLFRTTDGRWLIPTAEVSLTNIVREAILGEAELPLRFTALTPCFRSEAGAAGRDTRGLIRQHQFDKVEMVSITTPEQSDAEHERMTAAAEGVLEALGLPYRRMLLCTGDMGFSAARTYDLEVWLPGQARYREISSCSTCTDFQARRMMARYRPTDAKGTRFVHTLNGSGLAVGRTLVAVIENYQQADGSVVVPEVLRPYLGGQAVLEAALMRILLTNDDGYHAPGLAALERIAATLSDDVWIVAPAEDQSGTSRSLTLTRPMRLRQFGERRFAVTGTPTDSVLMALGEVMADHKPDLILSGVNRGANLGEDVLYSGTVSAAMEGALAGIRSVALSQRYAQQAVGDAVSFATAEAWGERVLRPLLDLDLAPRTLLNVNFPPVAPDAVKGIRVARQGLRDYGRARFERRADPRGYDYYWLALGRLPHQPGQDSDLDAIAADCIAVTPLQLDLTHEPSFVMLNEAYR